ncbi:MAG: HNH endonuclease [Thermus sp.]|uniref:HNH endonuclease n=1 Tax=unclassified Thermus TaxID=2619321 RepID=UPI00059B6813|nr:MULTISPECIES: HNH endonuclease [unclassified Thermus]MCS6868523.1 HNH endonuclease [Thermus sp.]MCS7218457.1 HNH endonuclease [Thermus sp.]MCX7849219.1 HNH endonuclease [Thermus sp.]MDW8016788.1 HNH endonuclease [Thermus sp.]
MGPAHPKASDLDAPRVLVLNAAYEVLGLASIKRSVLLVLSGSAEMVSESGRFLHTPSTRIPVPSVIRLKRLVRRGPSRIPLNRRNVLRRDRYTCQYCGRQGGELTVDHVLPRSRGGKGTWENLVAACRPCNLKKGDRTPEEAGMRLLKSPRAPRAPLFLAELKEVPEDWRPYLEAFLR